MGDQKFTCGRYKNHTFEDIAHSDPDFCKAVLKSPISNKYYPEEFKSYLLSLRDTTVTSINAQSVSKFVSQWDDKIGAEFEQMIGFPSVTIKELHPKAAGYSHGNLGVFVRFFFKKCIYNVQNINVVRQDIELLASIFPFKVSKVVPSVNLPVREFFDKQFYGAIAVFMVRHFENRCDWTDSYVDLFLRNVYHFKKTNFDEGSAQKLLTMVANMLDPDLGRFGTTHINDGMTFVNDYLKQFPRLNPVGVDRYILLRRMYNKLCTALGQENLGEQPARHIRMLPEINCSELLSLLEPSFYVGQRTKYIEYFLKYFFFFIYAVESATDHPLFFIDDPLYECLKGYAEYRYSREVPENLKLCIWQMTLVYRRTQDLYQDKFSLRFNVDEENLKNIRKYVENFEDIESAIVDFQLPNDLIALGKTIVTKDTMLRMYYRQAEKSNLTDFYKDIIRALMCPVDIKKVVIYNAYNGVETSVMIPLRKTEVLEFIRRYNKYNPDGPDVMEDSFARSVKGFLCS